MSSSARSLRKLTGSLGQLTFSDSLTQCLAPSITRSMATVAETMSPQVETPILTTSTSPSRSSPTIRRPLEHPVLTTLYSWPTMEPLTFAPYSSQHIDLPLRRDILHRAVVFEGDAHRRGTASTKWRDDVRGSGRKVLPQKGTGKARAGDKKSPIRRGGGVAFGPHPRDFSTGLNRKIYDIAWRTALSHRWRRGELFVTENTISLPWQATPHLLDNFFRSQNWGQGNGRSTLVTLNPRQRLNEAMENLGNHGVVKDLFDVDVKDLLETGRIIIERFALDALIGAHTSDLGNKTSLERSHGYQQDLARQYRRERMAARAQLDALETADSLSEEREIDSEEEAEERDVRI